VSGRGTGDGKTLVSAGIPEGLCQVKLWDVATAKERATIVIPGDSLPQFSPLAFSADGNTLISAMWTVHKKKKEGGLSVRHWDLATGKARATFWAPFNYGSNNAGFFLPHSRRQTVAWAAKRSTLVRHGVCLDAPGHLAARCPGLRESARRERRKQARTESLA
jgi:hypothetical protein